MKCKYTISEMELDIEAWLSNEIGFGMTQQEFIDLELAETGTDREMDFDSELAYEKRWSKWLKDIAINGS